MAKIDEQPPVESPAVRVIAMPADTNPHGDIFGGWLMSLMDSAAGSVAARYSHGRAVTIAVEGMTFHRPVIVGDEVSVFATLKSVGRTSCPSRRPVLSRDPGDLHLRGDR
jgi:acyl-CoA thioesterase YciA